jgi:hypothetical protein
MVKPVWAWNWVAEPVEVVAEAVEVGPKKLDDACDAPAEVLVAPATPIETAGPSEVEETAATVPELAEEVATSVASAGAANARARAATPAKSIFMKVFLISERDVRAAPVSPTKVPLGGQRGSMAVVTVKPLFRLFTRRLGDSLWTM